MQLSYSMQFTSSRMKDDITGVITDKKVTRYQSTNKLYRISKLHPTYLSSHYSLLFPYGEDGF